MVVAVIVTVTVILFSILSPPLSTLKSPTSEKRTNTNFTHQLNIPLDENLLVVLRLLQRNPVGLVLAEEAGRLEILHRLLGVELQKRLPEERRTYIRYRK